MSQARPREFRRVSLEQLKSMVDFMRQHVDLAMSLPRSTEFRHKSRKLWAELTKIMHSHSGARKTAHGWSKYWSDYKNKLKNKLRLIQIAKHKNELPSSVSLTKIEKKVLSILGKDYLGKKRTTPQDRLEQCDGIRDTKIKSELFDESTDYGHASECSDTIISDQDIDDTIQVLNVDCDRPIATDINIDNLCPQWLIESETKRAEAEMIRARAEEQRVSVASKMAEAAATQAEALKKLAEAATVQADALSRIATLIEPIAARLQSSDRQTDFGFRK